MIQSDALSLRSQQLLEQIIAEELNEQPLFGSSWIQQNNPNLSTDVRLAKTIAQQIYDSKRPTKDDLDDTLRAIKRIKDAKQFELVQTELRKLTGGRGIGKYIASFLGTMLMGVEINTTETLDIGRGIVKHLQNIKADPKTIAILNDRIAKSSLQKSLIDTGWGKGTPGVMGVEALNSVSDWIGNHDTWDTFINGTDGLRDMVYYDWRGVMITTILGFTPLKVIDIVIFSLFIIDDIKRFTETGFQWDILLELIFDVMGLFFGAVGKEIFVSLKAVFNPIGKVLIAIFEKLVSGGASRKIIERLIKLIMPLAERLAKSKIGQLIVKIGGKIENLISRVTNAASKALKSLIGAFLNIANKLKGTRFYKKAMAIVKMLTAATKWIIGSFIDAIKWIFKTIWAVISSPGKSIAWVLEKIGFKETGQVGKIVFNTTFPAYIVQNYDKWMDEYRQKTGVYGRDEEIDYSYRIGAVTFKQQSVEHIAMTTKGEYFKLPAEKYPWIFFIIKQQGKWTKITMADDALTMWVKTADIAKTYEEVQQ
jgi:hypothetical protein